MTFSKTKWWKRNRKAVYDRYASQPRNRMFANLRRIQKRCEVSGRFFDVKLVEKFTSNPPTRCACCKHKLDYSSGRGSGRNADRSPSFDRRNNQGGYTLRNTFVVCYRCNRIKADATWQELRTIARYARPLRKRKKEIDPEFGWEYRSQQ